MKAILLAVCFSSILALTGCNLNNLLGGDTAHHPSEVSGTGTIVYIDLEGGFYGLLAQDDRRFLPLNLKPEFKQDGLSVRFRVRIADDVVTIHQWGTPVKVLQITRN